MNAKNQILKLLALLFVLVVSTLGVRAQLTDTSTTQTVCIGIKPYRVDPSLLPNPVYHWNITGGTATDWEITGSGTDITIDWKTAGVYMLTAYTTADNCDGPPSIVTVTVNPRPIAVATPATQNACSDVAIADIVLTTSNGLDATTTFAWTRDNSTNVTGILASGNGNITGTLSNLTGTAQTVTFTIIPTSSNGCVGDPITATVVVGSEPIAVATPATQNACSDVAIADIVFTTSNGLDATTTFAWTRDNSTNVTGILASGNGNITGTLTNLTGTAQTVTFTIIPTSNGCVGDPITVTIIESPRPTTSPIYHN